MRNDGVNPLLKSYLHEMVIYRFASTGGRDCTGQVEVIENVEQLQHTRFQTQLGRSRLWSQTYDRALNDVLAIQTAIGEDVAKQLKRKLSGSPISPRPPIGEAYAIYLNARGLLRSGNPQVGGEATKLLEQVVRIDPQFAAGWSSLAEARQLAARSEGNEAIIAALPSSRAEARRALELDPDLAEAHGVLAMLVGDDSTEGISHLRRAAALDERSGQGFLWLANAQHTSGQYTKALASYRQAHDVDPSWQAPLRAMTDMTAAMGDRRATEALVRKEFADDPMLVDFALARTAWAFGEFSEAARRWSIVANSQARWAAPAKLSLEDAKLILGISNRAPSRKPFGSLSHARVGPRLWPDVAPTRDEWVKRNRRIAAELVYHEQNALSAKLMLNAGRAAELAATYDRPLGLLGMHKGQPLTMCRTRDAPLVALALRAAGRPKEAAALLTEAEAQVRYAYSQGTVPVWFEVDAAQVWATSGKPDLALNALERAMRRGWVSAGTTDLPRVEDEPTLRSLRGLPRFNAIRAHLKAHYLRERAETLAVIA